MPTENTAPAPVPTFDVTLTLEQVFLIRFALDRCMDGLSMAAAKKAHNAETDAERAYARKIYASAAFLADRFAALTGSDAA